MNTRTSILINAGADKSTPSGRLFFLDNGAGRVLTANPDGSDLRTLIDEGRKGPDGVVVDVPAGHIYWTNMGNFKEDDGAILRSDLDGKNMITIVPPGGTFTPKQIKLEKKSGKLYWSDREGMRVMRANLDGSKIETLVDTSQGDTDDRWGHRAWQHPVPLLHPDRCPAHLSPARPHIHPCPCPDSPRNKVHDHSHK